MRLLPTLLLAGLALACNLAAQAPTNAALAAGQAAADAAADADEQKDLSQALADAANSPVDYLRAAERHLLKYPESKQRAALEKSMAKAAMDLNDAARIILYGERVLAREQPDDTQLLDRVIRALVDKGDAQSGFRAYILVKRYEGDIAGKRTEQPPGHLSAAIWSDLLDANMASAMALEANAIGNAGKPEDAVNIAEKSWETYPSGEGARAAARWLSKLDRNREAMEYYANAFALEDPRTTMADRAGDRARLGELYRKVNQSEKGLGDLILAAYDRVSALRAARSANLRARDPNAETVEIPDFVLPAVDGTAPLRLSSLKGKTVVLDFWATWCVPCREQHPLIENVKRHFAGAPDVVFLQVDADDDPALAAPFVKEQSWESGYFEAGLARRLVISAIPTIVILDASGQVSSHLTGVETQRFEAILTQRIDEARQSH